MNNLSQYLTRSRKTFDYKKSFLTSVALSAAYRGGNWVTQFASLVGASSVLYYPQVSGSPRPTVMGMRFGGRSYWFICDGTSSVDMNFWLRNLHQENLFADDVNPITQASLQANYDQIGIFPGSVIPQVCFSLNFMTNSMAAQLGTPFDVGQEFHGHGSGAAIALLLSLGTGTSGSRPGQNCYQFGPCRVGDPNLANTVQKNIACFNIANNGYSLQASSPLLAAYSAGAAAAANVCLIDAVTCFPAQNCMFSTNSADDFSLAQFPYAHCGELLSTVNTGGTVGIVARPDTDRCDTQTAQSWQTAMAGQTISLLGNSASRHQIDLYVSFLANGLYKKNVALFLPILQLWTSMYAIAPPLAPSLPAGFPAAPAETMSYSSMPAADGFSTGSTTMSIEASILGLSNSFSRIPSP